MKGTIVNAAGVLIGSGIGLLFRQGIPSRYQATVMNGLALAVTLIGLQMAVKTQNILIVIISLVIGGIIGEALDLDAALNRIGEWLTKKLGDKHSNAGRGFITASLVYCIGAMAVVGSIQDGLTGDASTLYAKSMLDTISAVVFASSMGIGVALSSISVFLYQGTITMLAGFLAPVLNAAVIAEMTAVGGLLIVGVGLMMLEIKTMKLANLLPAIPLAAITTLLWPV